MARNQQNTYDIFHSRCDKDLWLGVRALTVVPDPKNTVSCSYHSVKNNLYFRIYAKPMHSAEVNAK